MPQLRVSIGAPTTATRRGRDLFVIQSHLDQLISAEEGQKGALHHRDTLKHIGTFDP